nr:MAG TPA: hypothetical protein [Caudoviricetes sp.]
MRISTVKRRQRKDLPSDHWFIFVLRFPEILKGTRKKLQNLPHMHIRTDVFR